MKDETILEGMRYPAREQLRQGITDLRAHRNHKGFRYEDSPKTRAYVFSCPRCEYYWAIDTRTLREQLPEVRENVHRLRRQYLGFGRKAAKKEQARALDKSRQLLFRAIPRSEVRKFKKLGYIEVKGTDSRVYRIEASGFHNVTTMISGVLHRYCLMPSASLPRYDIILAQKLWLEADTEAFLEEANLVEPRAEPSEDLTERVEIPHGVEEDPKAWVEEQINAQ